MNGGGTTPQISGYLEKKAKTGKWQKRWFETNAHFLTYYKTKKMEKLLAALNLPQVGEITLIGADSADPDNNGCLFTIELNTRIYTMRAATREDASHWVDVLKVLQAMDVEEAKSAVDESPSAQMVRSPGHPGGNPEASTHWKKQGGGICGACTSCFQSSA